jgi:hypothetical protein
MKINKKAVLSAALILFSMISVQAQVSVAPKIGLSYSNLEGDFTNSGFLPGAFFGGMLNARLHNYYSFQSGILLSGKGTTLKYSETDDDQILITYLEFPFNSLLTIPAGSGFIQIFAGPYIGLAINGRYKYLEDENNMIERLRIGTSENDEIKPLDAGFNFGAGFMFEGFEIQAGYSRSVSNVSNLPVDKLYNNVITISMAYFFGFNSAPSENLWFRSKR